MQQLEQIVIWCKELLVWYCLSALSHSASNRCKLCPWKRHRKRGRENEPSPTGNHRIVEYQARKDLQDHLVWNKLSGQLMVKKVRAGHCCRMINEIAKEESISTSRPQNYMPRWTWITITGVVIWSWEHSQGSWTSQSMTFGSPVLKMLIPS